VAFCADVSLRNYSPTGFSNFKYEEILAKLGFTTLKMRKLRGDFIDLQRFW